MGSAQWSYVLDPLISAVISFLGPSRYGSKGLLVAGPGQIRLPMIPECESLCVSLRLIWFPDRLPWKYVVEFGLNIGSRFERLAGGLGNQFA